MRIYDNGTYRDMTTEEIDELMKRQEEQGQIESTPSLSEKIQQLEEQNQMLTDCILEMSEILYQ